MAFDLGYVIFLDRFLRRSTGWVKSAATGFKVQTRTFLIGHAFSVPGRSSLSFVFSVQKRTIEEMKN